MLLVTDVNILAGFGDNEYIFSSIFQTLDFARIFSHLFHFLEKDKLHDSLDLFPWTFHLFGMF
jgi:hypothetical protein